MRFAPLAATAALTVLGIAAGIALSRPASASHQTESFADVSKQFRDAVEAHEFKKLPKLSDKLAKLKNPAAIPLMIGAIDSEGTLDTIYNVGFFGLASITGVPYDESHDGRWWRGWWETNKTKYPADVQKMEIVEFKGFVAKPNIRIPDADDVRSITSKAFYAGGDRNKLYLVSGPTGSAPSNGYKVLLVLPGGDGSIDMHAFVKRVQMNALGDGYLVAQLVAVKWTGGQQIVWPTKAAPVEGMKFGTEEFIESVIGEVKKNYKIDAKRVFTLGWSSSGPALYSYITTKPRSVTGTFQAMSVYHPAEMGPLDTLRGFPVYILHSPDDKTCPFVLAKKAQQALTEAGAKVGFDTYSGGHGWVDDPYGHISAGMKFLEENSG